MPRRDPFPEYDLFGTYCYDIYKQYPRQDAIEDQTYDIHNTTLNKKYFKDKTYEEVLGNPNFVFYDNIYVPHIRFDDFYFEDIKNYMSVPLKIWSYFKRFALEYFESYQEKFCELFNETYTDKASFKNFNPYNRRLFWKNWINNCRTNRFLFNMTPCMIMHDIPLDGKEPVIEVIMYRELFYNILLFSDKSLFKMLDEYKITYDRFWQITKKYMKWFIDNIPNLKVISRKKARVYQFIVVRKPELIPILNKIPKNDLKIKFKNIRNIELDKINKEIRNNKKKQEKRIDKILDMEFDFNSFQNFLKG